MTRVMVKVQFSSLPGRSNFRSAPWSPLIVLIKPSATAKSSSLALPMSGPQLKPSSYGTEAWPPQTSSSAVLVTPVNLKVSKDRANQTPYQLVIQSPESQ